MAGLDDNKRDVLASVAKGVTGAIPLVGPALAEVVGQTIPNQRMDRVAEFIRLLDQRLTDVELAQIKSNPQAIDLLEEATLIASRSVSDARRLHLVNLIREPEKIGSQVYEVRRKLLQILRELSDEDVNVLADINLRGDKHARWKRSSEPITEGTYRSMSPAEREIHETNEASWPLSIGMLDRLGLLTAVRQEQDSDAPDRHIDPNTGLPRIVRYEASELGKLLLLNIGEISELHPTVNLF